MKTVDNIDKYLTERQPQIPVDNTDDNEVSDHVKGIKHWLDDLEKQYSYGNVKGANVTMKNIMKAMKELKKSIK